MRSLVFICLALATFLCQVESNRTTLNNITSSDYVDDPDNSSLSRDSYETPLPPDYGNKTAKIPELPSTTVPPSVSSESTTGQDYDNMSNNNDSTDSSVLIDEDYEAPAQDNGLPRYAPDLNHTIQLLSNLAKVVDHSIHTMINEAVPHVSEFGYRFPLSENCILSLMQLLNAFKKQKAWAFRLIDSYGRPSAGFLEGSVTSLGDYDECLRVEFPRYFGEESPTLGKYCILRINFPFPRKPKRLRYHQQLVQLNQTDYEETVWSHLANYSNAAYTVKGLRFGVCIPSTCSADELEPLVKKIVEPALQMPIELGPDDECSVQNDWPEMLQSAQYAVLVFLVLSVLLVVGTAVHSDSQSQSSRFGFISGIKRLLKCFSVQANNRHLIKTETESPSTINGMIAITIMALIVFHTYFFGGFYNSTLSFNRWPEDIPANTGRLIYQIFLNSHLLTESLFFFSGFTLMSVVYSQIDKSGSKLIYLRYFGRKWLKYSSITVGVTLFYFLLPFIGSGPMYKAEVYQVVDNCEVNWWPHLLGISNLWWSMDKMCAPQLWLFSADLQLHLLAPLIVYSYRHHEVLGLVVNLSFIFSGLISSSIAALLNDSGPTFGLDHLIDQEYVIWFPSLMFNAFLCYLRYFEHQFNVAYLPTHLHISPFSLGILISFIIYKQQTSSKKFYLSRFSRTLFWLLACSTSLTVMFYSYLWNNPSTNKEPTTVVRVLFAGIHRTLWCLTLAWILFATSIFRASGLSRLLQSKVLLTISRLSYSIYAVYSVPIMLRRFSLKYTLPWDDHIMLSWAMLNIVLSIASGYLIYLTFEAPTFALFKLFTRFFSSRRKASLNISGNSSRKGLASFCRGLIVTSN